VGDEATIYGLYDYWLRGSTHRPPDRDLGDAIEARFPRAPADVRAAHALTLRTARWAAERGVSRFIRAGSVTLLPGARNVHDAARKVNPAAEVAYANRNEGAHALAEALLSPARLTSAVRAGVGDPAALLGSPPVSRWVRDGAPVALIIGAVMAFMPPGQAPGVVAAYAEGLPPGSVIAMSVALADDSPGAAELAGMLAPQPVYRHAAGDVTGWVEGAGLKLVQPVADVRLVIPGRLRPAGRLSGGAPGIVAGALAVKP
jgi:S-adenosyl methyltransferase